MRRIDFFGGPIVAAVGVCIAGFSAGTSGRQAATALAGQVVAPPAVPKPIEPPAPFVPRGLLMSVTLPASQRNDLLSIVQLSAPYDGSILSGSVFRLATSIGRNSEYSAPAAERASTTCRPSGAGV